MTNTSFDRNVNDAEDIQKFMMKHILPNYDDSHMLDGVNDLIHLFAKCFFIKYVKHDVSYDVSREVSRETNHEMNDNPLTTTSTTSSTINKCEDAILRCIKASSIIKKVFTIESRRIHGQPYNRDSSLRMYSRRGENLTEYNFHKIFDKFINKPTLLPAKKCGKAMKQLVIKSFMRRFEHHLEIVFNEGYQAEEIDFNKIDNPFYDTNFYRFEQIKDNEWFVEIDVRKSENDEIINGFLDILIYRNSMKYIIHIDVKNKREDCGYYPLIARLLHRPFTAKEIKMLKRFELAGEPIELYKDYMDSDNDDVPDDKLPDMVHLHNVSDSDDEEENENEEE